MSDLGFTKKIDDFSRMLFDKPVLFCGSSKLKFARWNLSTGNSEQMNKTEILTSGIYQIATQFIDTFTPD